MKRCLVLFLILFSPLTFAMSANNWLIRVRGVDVDPSVSSDTITVIGGKVRNGSSQVVPELDINYFFTPYVSTELTLMTSRHSFNAQGTALGKVNLGSVRIVPPTLTVKLHAFPEDILSPYVGVGVNYTNFSSTKKGPLITSIDYDSSVGPAFQVGVDIGNDPHWSFNIDVKKIYVKTDVSFAAGGAPMKADVRVDPLVYGVGVGYRFS